MPTPTIKCQQCAAAMKKTKKVDSDLSLQVIGLLLFFVACVLLFIFPLGTIAGIILMIAAGRMGHKRYPIWLCPNCGYYFKRA